MRNLPVEYDIIDFSLLPVAFSFTIKNQLKFHFFRLCSIGLKMRFPQQEHEVIK